MNNTVQIVGTAGTATKDQCIAAARAVRTKIEDKERGKLAMAEIQAIKKCSRLKIQAALT